MKKTLINVTLIFTFLAVAYAAPTASSKATNNKHAVFTQVESLTHKLTNKQCQYYFSTFSYYFKGKYATYNSTINDHHKIADFKLLAEQPLQDGKLIIWAGKSIDTTGKLADSKLILAGVINRSNIIKGVMFNKYCKAHIVIENK